MKLILAICFSMAYVCAKSTRSKPTRKHVEERRDITNTASREAINAKNLQRSNHYQTKMDRLNSRQALRQMVAARTRGEEAKKCSPQAAAVEDVRLIAADGTLHASAGRVEVFRDGRWGSICGKGLKIMRDSNYDKTFTKVICRMFGFQDGELKEHAHFGEGSGPIANMGEEKFQYRCDYKGLEKTLEVCEEDTYLAEEGVRKHGPCTHKDDVGVICRSAYATGDIRLIDAPTPAVGGDYIAGYMSPEDVSRGTVEVFDRGEWSAVCDDGMVSSTKRGSGFANVTCRILGYSRGKAFTHDYSKECPRKTGCPSIRLKEVDCRGDEKSLFGCRGPVLIGKPCEHKRVVGVTCED